MTKRESEIFKGIIKIIKRYLDPEKILLFGSRAKKDYKGNADFDIAIKEKEKVNTDIQRKIKEEIEKISGLYKVDIIFLNEVEKEFKEIVLKNGRVVYERSK